MAKKKQVAPLSDSVTDEEKLVMRVVAATGFPKAIVKEKVAKAQGDFKKATTTEQLLQLLKPKKKAKDEKQNELPVLPAEPAESPAD